MTRDAAHLPGDRETHAAGGTSGVLVASDEKLAELLPKLAPHDRIAVDTEADSLHSYREKLCLVQISVPGGDYIVDPLAAVDLDPLGKLWQGREIVLHGADYDLRLLRRGFNFTADRVFDTVIAARLLGIREFSLAVLLKRFFDVDLVKGSQKANWARRPLPPRMIEYALNDTRYLLPLAEQLEGQLRERGRLEWFDQSCRRAIEQAAIDRERDLDEAWRISGAGALDPRTGAILRGLWHWREREAAAVDRPAFHILQNQQLIQAAEKFAQGEQPDFHHFSPRRRQAFRDAAAEALRLPEKEWPVMRRRGGKRPTAQMVRRAEQLRERRDRAAGELKVEPTILAPRATIDAIASDEGNAANMLVPWQREVLGLSSA